MNKTRLKKYANLIARCGVNVQKGQEVVVNAGLDQPEFVKMVVDECYKAGAKKVSVEWSYQPLTKLNVRYCTEKVLSTMEKWQIEKLEHRAEVLPCMIAFSGGAEEFDLQYHTVSTVQDPFAPVATLTGALEEHLQGHYRAELESGMCLTGPHKDDFEVSLSGINLKAFGSQGQTRTAAISLKLAQRELQRREFGEEPVLLLDDVLSELDPARQDFVLNQITSGQVFITCCEPGKFTQLGKTIEISNGQLKIDN